MHHNSNDEQRVIANGFDTPKNNEYPNKKESKEKILVNNKKEKYDKDNSNRKESKKEEETNLEADTETVPKKYMTTDEIIKQINEKHGILIAHAQDPSH